MYGLSSLGKKECRVGSDIDEMCVAIRIVQYITTNQGVWEWRIKGFVQCNCLDQYLTFDAPKDTGTSLDRQRSKLMLAFHGSFGNECSNDQRRIALKFWDCSNRIGKVATRCRQGHVSCAFSINLRPRWCHTSINIDHDIPRVDILKARDPSCVVEIHGSSNGRFIILIAIIIIRLLQFSSCCFRWKYTCIDVWLKGICCDGNPLSVERKNDDDEREF